MSAQIIPLEARAPITPGELLTMMQTNKDLTEALMDLLVALDTYSGIASAMAKARLLIGRVSS